MAKIKKSLITNNKQKTTIKEMFYNEILEQLIFEETDNDIKKMLRKIKNDKINISIEELEGTSIKAKRKTLKDVKRKVLINDMNDKQYNACKHYIETGDKEYALLKAGYSQSVVNNPHKIFELETVKKFLELSQDEFKSKGIMSEEEMFTILSDIARDNDVSTENRLKAINQIGNLKKNAYTIKNMEMKIELDASKKKDQSIIKDYSEYSEEELKTALTKIEKINKKGG